MVTYDDEEETLEITAFDDSGAAEMLAVPAMSHTLIHENATRASAASSSHHPGLAHAPGGRGEDGGWARPVGQNGDARQTGGSLTSTQNFVIRLPAGNKKGPDPFFMSSAPRPRRKVLLRVNSMHSHLSGAPDPQPQFLSSTTAAGARSHTARQHHDMSVVHSTSGASVSGTEHSHHRR